MKFMSEHLVEVLLVCASQDFEAMLSSSPELGFILRSR